VLPLATLLDSTDGLPSDPVVGGYLAVQPGVTKNVQHLFFGEPGTRMLGTAHLEYVVVTG
jgi:hypothetical protein